MAYDSPFAEIFVTRGSFSLRRSRSTVPVTVGVRVEKAPLPLYEAEYSKRRDLLRAAADFVNISLGSFVPAPMPGPTDCGWPETARNTRRP